MTVDPAATLPDSNLSNNVGQTVLIVQNNIKCVRIELDRQGPKVKDVRTSGWRR